MHCGVINDLLNINNLRKSWKEKRKNKIRWVSYNIHLYSYGLLTWYNQGKSYLERISFGHICCSIFYIDCFLYILLGSLGRRRLIIYLLSTSLLFIDPFDTSIFYLKIYCITFQLNNENLLLPLVTSTQLFRDTLIMLENLCAPKSTERITYLLLTKPTSGMNHYWDFKSITWNKLSRWSA